MTELFFLLNRRHPGESRDLTAFAALPVSGGKEKRDPGFRRDDVMERRFAKVDSGPSNP
ncbi:hypothetical protein [Sphingomonas sp. YL-JM2C]